MFLFAGILFMAVGAAAFFKPELIWSITEQWKSNYADEPSELYKLSTRIGGTLIFLSGAAAIVCQFVLK